MKLGNVCRRNVVTVPLDAKLIEAAVRMRDDHVAALVIVELHNGRFMPVGVLTERDIVVGVLADDAEHLAHLDVGDVLTSPLLVASEGDEVSDVLERMQAGGARHAPVVDAGGELVGIFTLDDFVVRAERDMDRIATLLAHQPETTTPEMHARKSL